MITGGSGGVGRASAERFLEDGYRVVIADINEARLNEVSGELEKKHPAGVMQVVCDVTRTTDCRKAVEKTMRITDIRLIFKSGGKSGKFLLEEES